MSDQGLKQKVLDELAWEPSINAAHIGVTAREGVVTLTGHVESYAEKWAAERSAERVSGVKAVAEDVEVRYAQGAGLGDEDIAKRALQVLSWDIFVPRDKVKVRIEKGRVTLTGDLDWHYQKSAAEADIRQLHGVTSVANQITIKPSVQASDVHTKIKAALGRNAQIDADNIVVTTDGGKVTLSGKVDSYHERTMAESTAWSAPGVTQVKDLITVAL